MRESLRETVNHALCIEMKLPNIEKNLDKTSITTAQDICMKNDEKSELAKIIYNGIVEYAVNEYELNYDDLEKEQAKVLARRIRYNSNATDFTKLKYGFYGEVLLDLILRCFLKTDVLLARGYLYSPIEKSEVRDKITLYESIIHLDIAERESIDNLVNSVVFSRGHKINWDGLQTVLNIIAPIVSNGKLKFMITHKFIAKSGKQYSLLVILLQAYLDNGFMGMVEYQIKNKGMNMDRAMRYVADTVYNTFKYQLVKYFGTFDILYRFVQSKERQCDMEDVKSISFLLQKLEYNATNERAKKVSDYGVPFKIIKKYEDPSVQVEYDPYEKYVDNQVKLMLNE